MSAPARDPRTRYNPGVFGNHFQSETGKNLWAFLNQEDTLVRLETASALDRPAVEAIEEPLLEKFKAEILEDRVKQMVGHMVRQIMERRGYVIGVQNTKITNGAPFSRATKYRLPDDMVFHVFRSTTDPRTLALRGDKAGARLLADKPRPGTKWSYWKSFRGGLRGRIAFGLENEEIGFRLNALGNGQSHWRGTITILTLGRNGLQA